MSILKSTHSGYKYYYGKDLLNKCCEFYKDGEKAEFEAIVNEDGSIDVKPDDGKLELTLYSKTLQRELGKNGTPPEWFTDMPFKMFRFIAPSKNYLLVIKKPFDKVFRFNEITTNIKIECEIPDITDYFHKTRINGDVTVDDKLKEIYPNNFLYNKRICPYFGKEYMGF